MGDEEASATQPSGAARDGGDSEAPGAEPAGEPQGDAEAPGADCADGDAGAVAATSSKTIEELKELGNQAFKKAQLLKRTTAGRQYLEEAKNSYGKALSLLGSQPANDDTLGMACTLHNNLAAVFLQETPPNYQAAKAAAEIALSVNPKHVKALYRKAQATLEDGRQGLPEESLRAALDDLRAAREAEPGNAQVVGELERIERRIAALEAARKVPEPQDIAKKISSALLDRGSDLLSTKQYLWGQTESTVHIFVPARGVRVTKSSEVTCEVRVQSLSLSLPTAEEGKRLELGGKLHKPVQPDECSWQLEDGGLLLHVELQKRNQSPEGEHWQCVWHGHEQTKAPSAEERKEIKNIARAACMAEEREKEQPPQPKHPAADETVRKLKEMCPGVNIEWGDTSFGGFR